MSEPHPTQPQRPKMPAQTLKVTKMESGQRLDNYLLKHLKGVPRTHIYRIVRDGQVRVNGGRVRPFVRLALDDRVRIPPLRRPEPGVGASDQNLLDLTEAILYEDEYLLVLNKPAGVAVHGGTGLRGGLIEFMRAQSKDHLELIHRLDKDTSGALMLAKDSQTLRAMHAVLRQPERGAGIKKTYRALLVGRWHGGKRELKHRLQTFRGPGQIKRSEVSSEGREAHSIFNPVTRFFEHTLMDVEIKTGRLHQVRVHAQAIGLPVAGDRIYGTADANRHIRKFGLTRQFLHADRLIFQHPIEKRQLDIHAPLPNELDSVLGQLQTQLTDSRSS